MKFDMTSYFVKANIAMATKVPDILMSLSKDTHVSVRYYVAGNTSTPKQALLDLSKDSNYGVRSNVASNPNSPEEALINIKKLNMLM